jgi:hypothetical protein
MVEAGCWLKDFLLAVNAEMVANIGLPVTPWALKRF